MVAKCSKFESLEYEDERKLATTSFADYALMKSIINSYNLFLCYWVVSRKFSIWAMNSLGTCHTTPCPAPSIITSCEVGIL
jgi:hypothetical protein